VNKPGTFLIPGTEIRCAVTPPERQQEVCAQSALCLDTSYPESAALEKIAASFSCPIGCSEPWIQEPNGTGQYSPAQIAEGAQRDGMYLLHRLKLAELLRNLPPNGSTKIQLDMDALATPKGGLIVCMDGKNWTAIPMGPGRRAMILQIVGERRSAAEIVLNSVMTGGPGRLPPDQPICILRPLPSKTTNLQVQPQ
jgi:hypothetical protein